MPATSTGRADDDLHLNVCILAYAEATGCETLMTGCNVYMLNLRQAIFQLQADEGLLERVNKKLAKVGVPEYRGTVDAAIPLDGGRGRGLRPAQGCGAQGVEGAEDRAVLRLPDPAPSKLLEFEDPDWPSSLERIIEACGGEAIDYPAKISCRGFPIIQAREETALASRSSRSSRPRKPGPTRP